jgi:phosphatidylserine/phosphatidylglycerophosphate/cardiolipin synthase-like enzyme
VVHEFMKLYLERWNRHYLVKLHVVPDLPPPPQVNAVSDGSCFVQVTRTMPADAVILTGIQDSVEAVKCAVGRARRYIYIEDQYLWPYWGHGDVPYDSSLDPSGMVQALSDALDRPGFEYLLILIPGHVSVGQGRYRRREFLDTLKRKVKPENASKIHVYYLRTRAAKSAAIAAKAVLIDEDEADVIIADAKLPDDLPEEVKQSIVDMQPSGGDHHAGEIYVHTKVWIVDDVYVKCGSMNCNVRGFTYDSEADFHAVDGAVTRGKRRLALDLRKSLWAEHGRAEREDVPDDIVDALAWWQGRVTPTSRLAPYDTSGDKLKLPPQIPLAAFDFDWRTILDPDGSGTIV